MQSRKRGPGWRAHRHAIPVPVLLIALFPPPPGTIVVSHSDKLATQMADNRKKSWKLLLAKG